MAWLKESEASFRHAVAAFRNRKTSLAGVVSLIAPWALVACGVVGGGGPPQEEYDALDEKYQNIKADLQDALGRNAGEQANTAAARKQLVDFMAEVEQERNQAAARAVEGRISLEKARLEAIRYAQTHLEVYSQPYRNIPLVWEVESASEDEEFYYVNLTYRPFAGFEGTVGREEFLMDKTGKIEFRQVLDEPKAAPTPAPKEGGGG